MMLVRSKRHEEVCSYVSGCALRGALKLPVGIGVGPLRTATASVFGTEAPSERSVCAWFQCFKAGNKKLEDEPRSGRPTAISFDELKNLAEQHSYEGVRYFGASLGCSLSTVSNGLRSLRVVKMLEAADSTDWTPLSLEMKNGSSTSTTPTNVHEEGHAERLVRSSWNLPFRAAAGRHDSYCRGLLRSTAKTGREDPQGAPKAQQRSLAAR
ncbi:hypothetical protein RB195_021765 [Necator americanus]|uniref:Mos1 transposase HTH domain-containing protein n=1 Tax=Necator americanus TaxID=51031 RepID=A0ABR1ECL2_NECAM